MNLDYIILFPVPGPTPTMYPIGSMAYRQAVQQFDQSSNLFFLIFVSSTSELFLKLILHSGKTCFSSIHRFGFFYQ